MTMGLVMISSCTAHLDCLFVWVIFIKPKAKMYFSSRGAKWGQFSTSSAVICHSFKFCFYFIFSCKRWWDGAPSNLSHPVHLMRFLLRGKVEFVCGPGQSGPKYKSRCRKKENPKAGQFLGKTW